MIYPSYLELDRSALHNNLEYLTNLVGDDVKFCSVVKGNAYGHGIKQFVPLAEEFGVRQFGVYSTDEAVKTLRAITEPDSRIMVMGYVDNEDLEWAITNEISFYIFELDRMRATINAAKQVGKKAHVHLQIETGMNRIGLTEGQAHEVIKMIKENDDHVFVEGICTHFAGAESVSNHVRITNQIEEFKRAQDYFQDKGIEPQYYHAACSAAVFNYPETIMDMVRVGIAQYGFWPNRETYMNYMKNSEHERFEDPLRRVLSWKSKVMSTKDVEAGEFVGYGNIYLTNRDQQMATIPMGYTHGYGRNLTNRGVVLINGERAQVVGVVNMNLVTVDITDIPNVKKGDEVVIIGHQGDNEITVASFSEMSDFLNYEVLTRIPEDLPRYIVEHHSEAEQPTSKTEAEAT
jgi:alanine racemase